MGRGVSSGGGQSSLGYLFGDGEAPKTATENARTPPSEGRPVSKELPQKPNAAAYQSIDVSKQIPAGIHSSTANYLRADGQNSANFITTLAFFEFVSKILELSVNSQLKYLETELPRPVVELLIQDRPSTKVHAAPGGGSSLDYLFGGGSK